MEKRIYFFLSGALLCLSLCQPGWAKNYTVNQLPQLKQDEIQQVVAQRVKDFFTQSHYRIIDLNQQFAEQIFNRYLDLLDYNHAILTQADVAKFSNRQTELLEELKSGKVNLAFEIYNFVAKKRFQRYAFALQQLQQPFVFDTKQTLNLKHNKQPWVKSEAGLDEYWRKRVLNDAVGLALTKKTVPQIRENLSKRYQRMQRSLIQANSEDVFQLFMNAFAREIDPHTSYLAPRVKRDFDSQMRLSFEGIGATLSMEDDYTVIKAFVPGGPAEKSKQLAIGDKIIGVGQKDKTIEDVIGQRLDNIVDMIRGPKGSQVQLEILPADNSKAKVIELTRDTVRMEDRQAKSSVKMTSRGKVGVIEIPGFYIGLSQHVAKQLADLQKQQIKALVIDLRNNGGGSLAEVITLTGLFINRGPVVQVRDTLKRVRIYADQDGLTAYQGPIVVLVNRYSASASEIFAAAMQDYQRAVVVGETTFGKGTVQASRNIAYPIDKTLHPDWPSMGGVQYTIQKFYRINGGSTQLKGVTPDIFMTPTQMDYDIGERFLDNALPWDSIQAAKHRTVRPLAVLLPRLKSLHEQRIQRNPEFTDIMQDIQRYNEHAAQRDRLSLNLQQREQEQAENDQRELDRVNRRLAKAGKAPLKTLEELPKDYKEPDVFLTEAQEIAMDLAAKWQ